MQTKKVHIASFAAVAFVTLMCTTGAHAQQNSFQGRFTLPFEVHWSSAVLPAGEYSIVIPQLSLPGIVRPAAGGRDMRISIGHPGDMESGMAYLTVVSRDKVLTVISMNMPSLKLSLVYAPAVSERGPKSQVAMRFPIN